MALRALHHGVNDGCNTVCKGYFDTCYGLLEEPFAGLSWLRNEAWKSWGTLLAGCLLAEVGYFALLPLYVTWTLLFGVLQFLTLPLQCCSCTPHEARSRFHDIFWTPCWTALLLMVATVKALFYGNFTSEVKERPAL